MQDLRVALAGGKLQTRPGVNNSENPELGQVLELDIALTEGS